MTKDVISTNSSLNSAPPFRNTLRKAERLSKKKSFDLIFKSGKSFMAEGIRVHYYIDLPENLVTAPVMAGFVVPRKRFKRAVDRNRMKRRMKEAYRTQKGLILPGFIESKRNIALLFVFAGHKEAPFSDIHRYVSVAVEKIKSLV